MFRAYGILTNLNNAQWVGKLWHIDARGIYIEKKVPFTLSTGVDLIEKRVYLKVRKLNIAYELDRVIEGAVNRHL
jgi:hypothetical protein